MIVERTPANPMPQPAHNLSLRALICPQCKTENPPDTKNCISCGRVLKHERYFRRCPECRTINIPGKKKCRKCGARMTP
ncbi:MAG: zinc ribbon domain-containing protein [Candidatus Bathyarchaeota archaeon]|nr:zinc ribbon domain-containing protein [Candidatus Bathyarchaeota archaeon]